MGRFTALLLLAASVFGCKGPPPTLPAIMAKEPTRLLWGDTHLHTSYSPDAFFLGNTSADPDTAYRWARGLPVVHPSTRSRVQIGTPLDFLVVADHAEMLGVPHRIMKGDPALTATATGRRWAEMIETEKGRQTLGKELKGAVEAGRGIPELDTPEIRASSWEATIDAAERNYQPCSFTTFLGWEWTSTPGSKNLHRVVMTPAGRREAEQFVPFSAIDSERPEDLWDWFALTSNETGADFIAIPHNSNLSGGLMFDEVDSDGRPITAAYARTRMRWEPVVEVTQMGGDSETHPKLSPDDELADFERFRHREAPVEEGDYVRTGLLRGMQLEAETGENPYKLGMIGSTDSHTGLASAEEDNFWGKTALDSTPLATLGPGMRGADRSASGLAAVWAEENTRTAIFAALKRKEVYATTGPRIRLRFFGGWEFKKKHASTAKLVNVGYLLGHPMGSDLTAAPEDEVPKFLVYAVRDPNGANLDRIQIVKGWVDEDGEAHEKVYDVTLAGSRQLDEQGRASPVASTVDTERGRYDDVFGAPALTGYWEDSAFNPKERSFYYVRAIQVPTPRHSLLDAVALEVDASESGRPTEIQERAYSSPIWYTPSE